MIYGSHTLKNPGIYPSFTQKRLKWHLLWTVSAIASKTSFKVILPPRSILPYKLLTVLSKPAWVDGSDFRFPALIIISLLSFCTRNLPRPSVPEKCSSKSSSPIPLHIIIQPFSAGPDALYVFLDHVCMCYFSLVDEKNISMFIRKDFSPFSWRLGFLQANFLSWKFRHLMSWIILAPISTAG